MGLATRAARARRGAISLSIASHLPVMLASYSSRPVRLPPGRARLATKPEPIGSETVTNTIGIARLSRCNAAVDRCRMCEDHVGLQGDQLFREHLTPERRRAQSECRCGHCGPPTIRASRAPAGIPRGAPSCPDRPRRGPPARRCAASARAAARAPRAATRPPRRRAA